MAGYWPCSFLACLCTETESKSINCKKRMRPIYSHLDRTNLVNKGCLAGQGEQSRAGKIAPSCPLG